jgi:porin
MRNRTHHHISSFLCAGLMLALGAVGYAQGKDAGRTSPESPQPAPRFMEDLNYVGGEAAMPPFSDSLIDPNSDFRRGLFTKGLAFRVIQQAQYAQNTLDPPVAPDDQVYVGQRWFTGEMIQPILTADLRQLGLRRAQLCIGGVWNWVSWRPAGPKALQLWNLYLYKEFGEDRLEIKVGYVSNNMNFVGFFVGGSTATGVMGVYAVLPFEVGLSFFPLTAPSFDARLSGPRHTYLKTAAQRSIDPEGGPAEVARNHSGFRFDPHGDKLFAVGEGGYLRAAAKRARQAWLRAGYMRNQTAYWNEATGRAETGNHCAYVLGDYQVLKSAGEQPSNGLYAGGSFITVPQTKNAYARYFEARLYKEGPFRSRPGDVLSVIASRTSYSSVFTDHLRSQGKTVWRAGTTLTGSYSLHASRGNYLSLGLSYVNGPAITPRVPNALNFMATWSLFF